MFITYGPVEPELFIGREKELRNLERWIKLVSNYVIVLGSRQTGKTSLLLKLRSLLQNRYSFAFIDLQSFTGLSNAQFYRSLCQEIKAQLGKVLDEPIDLGTTTGVDFLYFLSEISRISKVPRIIIMLDEMGGLSSENAHSIADTARSAFTQRQLKIAFKKLVFIFSGATDMQKLMNGEVSPLKNITQQIYITDFSREEVEKLLRMGFEEGGITISKEVIDRIYHWTGGHPYLTQRLGSLIEDTLFDSPDMKVDSSLVDSVVARLHREGDVNLQHIMRHLGELSPSDLAKVHEINSGRKPVRFSRTDPILERLELIGIIRAGEDGNCVIRNGIYNEAWNRSFLRPVDIITPPSQKQWEYYDFEILVGEKGGKGYPIHVIESPRGNAKGFLPLDYESSDFQDMLSMIEYGQTDERLLTEFGELLFEYLFPDEIEDLYRNSLGWAQGRGRGLRIRLRLSSPELSYLPWEYLYDKRHERFFAVSTEIPLVRYIEVSESIRPLQTSHPFHLLVVISNPTDLAEYRLSSLDSDKERGIMKEALTEWEQKDIVKLEFLDNAIASEIRDKIRRFHPHVFHFIGHGYFQGKEAELVIENEDHTARFISDKLFRELFLDSEVRLVVLNSCEGATSSPFKPFIGIAPNIVRRGIPAVVAMQYNIYDDTALKFSQEFYRSLGIGYPVDAAISEARRGIYIDFGAGRRDWGIPVLFMRAKDGVIINFEERS